MDPEVRRILIQGYGRLLFLEHLMGSLYVSLLKDRADRLSYVEEFKKGLTDHLRVLSAQDMDAESAMDIQSAALKAAEDWFRPILASWSDQAQPATSPIPQTPSDKGGRSH